jgi:hypothetical protein
MAIVAAVAVRAGILDAEELEPLVILLTSSCHRGKFIAATPLERGCRTAIIARAPAAAATTPATALARTA